MNADMKINESTSGRPEPTKVSHPSREKQLETIKNQIKNGTYSLNVRKIAEAMVQRRAFEN